MSDIQSLIKMLQSSNPDERHDACKELEASESLPPEALEALRLVTKDVDSTLAEAAQRALAVHNLGDNKQKQKQDVMELDYSNTWASAPAPLVPIGLLLLINKGGIGPFLWKVGGEAGSFFVILCVIPVGVLGGFIFGIVTGIRSVRRSEIKWPGYLAIGFNVLVILFLILLVSFF